EGAIFGLKNPILIAIVAGAIETVVVPVSVIAQKLLTARLKKPAAVTIEAQRDLFSGSVASTQIIKPKRGFCFWVIAGMFLLSAIYFSYQILGLMIRGKGLPVVDMLFFNPPETVNTLMKISFLFLLANIGAFNATIRREAALLLFAVNLISVAASLWLYFG